MEKSLNMSTNMHPLQEVQLISIEGFMALLTDRLILECLKRKVMIIPYGRFLVGISKLSDSMKSMMRRGMLTLMPLEGNR